MTLFFIHKRTISSLFCIVFSISLFGQGQSQFSVSIDTMSFITIDGYSESDYFGSSMSYAGDLNNDGYDDFIIGVKWSDRYLEDAGSAYIFYGGEIFNNDPDLIINGKAKNDHWGSCVSYAGDVNSDGFSDVIIGGSTGYVKLYFGGNEMDNISDITFNKEFSGGFGYSVSNAGDFNNDGFDDIIITSNNESDNGLANLYFGGSKMDSIPDIVFSENEKSGFINTVAYAGDLNNDGYDDVMIGDYGYEVNNIRIGRVYIYLGNSENDSNADVILTGFGLMGEFAQSIASAGDVNNDGYDDIIVGQPYCGNMGPVPSSHTLIYFGGVDMDTIADVIIKESPWCLGMAVSSAGDINNDGYDDVIIGGYGNVNFYFGAKNMDSISDFNIINDTVFSGFGKSISFLGDINADGINEYLIGEPFYSTTEKNQVGRVYIYTTHSITGIKNIAEKEPILNIYPNPFNTGTTIEFNIKKPEKVNVKIFNSIGQEIETLTDNFQTTGTHRIEWQPGNLPSVLYFCKIQSASIFETKKLLLQK